MSIKDNIIDIYKNMTMEKRGFLNSDELKIITEKLRLNEATSIDELRETRNLVVITHGELYDDKEEIDMDSIDKMSAMVSVIDHLIWNLGGEV